MQITGFYSDNNTKYYCSHIRLTGEKFYFSMKNGKIIDSFRLRRFRGIYHSLDRPSYSHKEDFLTILDQNKMRIHFYTNEKIYIKNIYQFAENLLQDKHSTVFNESLIDEVEKSV